MARSETEVLKLVKPDYDEFADIEIINSNMDKLDRQFPSDGIIDVHSYSISSLQDSIAVIGDSISNIEGALSSKQDDPVVLLDYAAAGRNSGAINFTRSVAAPGVITLYYKLKIDSGRVNWYGDGSVSALTSKGGRGPINIHEMRINDNWLAVHYFASLEPNDNYTSLTFTRNCAIRNNQEYVDVNHRDTGEIYIYRITWEPYELD